MGWQADEPASVDLTTRRGLKQIHADFTRIYDRMNTMYNNNLDKEKITGGIVGVWAKMCTDSLLMHKLFEKGQMLRLARDHGVYLIIPRVALNMLYRLPGETLAAPR